MSTQKKESCDEPFTQRPAVLIEGAHVPVQLAEWEQPQHQPATGPGPSACTNLISIPTNLHPHFAYSFSHHNDLSDLSGPKPPPSPSPKKNHHHHLASRVEELEDSGCRQVPSDRWKRTTGTINMFALFSLPLIVL